MLFDFVFLNDSVNVWEYISSKQTIQGGTVMIAGNLGIFITTLFLAGCATGIIEKDEDPHLYIKDVTSEFIDYVDGESSVEIVSYITNLSTQINNPFENLPTNVFRSVLVIQIYPHGQDIYIKNSVGEDRHYDGFYFGYKVSYYQTNKQVSLVSANLHQYHGAELNEDGYYFTIKDSQPAIFVLVADASGEGLGKDDFVHSCHLEHVRVMTHLTEERGQRCKTRPGFQFQRQW